MSILSELFQSITGSSKAESETVVDRPCANCPSDCAIAGDACNVCEPYKKKLIDVIYYVNNLDEYYNRYEVTGTAESSSGTITCPFCGGQSANLNICDYCGSKLSDATDSAKIKVANASDIPNPIMQAQDIIYERADAVIAKYSDNSSSDGILSKLASLLTGSSADESDSELGAKMSEEEIKEIAGLYGVSVGDYLTGLDNGKYLTLKGYNEANGSSASYAPAAFGAAGLAGVGLLASNLFRKNSQSAIPKPYDAHEHQPPQNAPGQYQMPHAAGNGGPRGNGGHGSPQHGSRDRGGNGAPQHGGGAPGGNHGVGPGGSRGGSPQRSGGSQRGGGPGGRMPR